jgi:hypothetical protein
MPLLPPLEPIQAFGATGTLYRVEWLSDNGVRVEIRPVYGRDDRLAAADDFRRPGSEHLPHDDALIAQQPIDLLDGVFAEQAARLRQGLADIASASDALVMTSSTPFTRDQIRLACKLSEKTPRR